MQHQEELVDAIVDALKKHQDGVLDTSDVIFLQTPDVWCQLIPTPAVSGNPDRTDVRIMIVPMKGPLSALADVQVTLGGENNSYAVVLNQFGRGTIYDAERDRYKVQLQPNPSTVPDVTERPFVTGSMAGVTRGLESGIKAVLDRMRPVAGSFRIPEPGVVGGASGSIGASFRELSNSEVSIEERARIASQLGLLGDISAAPALIGVLSDRREDQSVREAAATALAVLGDKEGQEALRALAELPAEEDSAIREQIQSVLNRVVRFSVDVREDRVVVQVTSDARWSGSLARLVWEPDDASESSFERFLVLKPIRSQQLCMSVFTFDTRYDLEQLQRGTFRVQGPFPVSDFLDPGPLAATLARTLSDSVQFSRNDDTWDERLQELSATRSRALQNAIAKLNVMTVDNA